MNFHVKIILFYRRNLYTTDIVQELVNKILISSENRANCEVAYSSGDLWFILSKNIENCDIVHIFSSEKQNLPESVSRFLKVKKSGSWVKIHYTGSSFDGYASKVGFILNAQLKELSSRKDCKLFIKPDCSYELLNGESEIKEKIWENNTFEESTKNSKNYIYT